MQGANKEALAVAHVSGANFIRAEGYVFSHVADEGWMDACAGELLRYRKSIGAENVLVFTDVKKKHRLVPTPLYMCGHSLFSLLGYVCVSVSVYVHGMCGYSR